MINPIGNPIIAFVWSFRDQLAEIPYRIEQTAGTRPRKTCTCPAFSYSGGSTCKHLQALKKGIKDGTILTNDKFQLTAYGKESLGL
jgi:hypothetical protein